MTQTEWKPRTQGILEILPEEISDFETQVARFRAGEWSENDLWRSDCGRASMDSARWTPRCFASSARLVG